MILGLQPLHLLLILAIALLIFGPSLFGRFFQSFRRMFTEMRSAAKGEDKNAPDESSSGAAKKK